jgi:hypothetical protein
VFAISTNDLMNAAGPPVATSLYADAVAVHLRSRSMGTIEPRLQGAVNRLSRSDRENGFTFSPEGSKHLHFTRLRGLHPDPCLCLRNRVLPFVRTLKFLGLILDSKLSWEPHMRYLRVKCERSLNILKVLYGRSRGGDRTVMLGLYPELICSKTDSGSFVSASAKNSKMYITDRLHSSGLRPLAPFVPAARRVCMRNPANPNYPPGGIFSATTSRGWQRNPRILHTQPCSVPPVAIGTTS